VADDACGDVGCLAEFAAELMADMTEFEAQFTEPEKIRVVAGRLCKDCGIQPSYDSACESCWSVDGDCCYCRNCGGKRLDQLAAGAIEMQAKAMAAGEVPTIHGLRDARPGSPLHNHRGQRQDVLPGLRGCVMGGARALLRVRRRGPARQRVREDSGPWQVARGVTGWGELGTAPLASMDRMGWTITIGSRSREGAEQYARRVFDRIGLTEAPELVPGDPGIWMVRMFLPTRPRTRPSTSRAAWSCLTTSPSPYGQLRSGPRRPRNEGWERMTGVAGDVDHSYCSQCGLHEWQCWCRPLGDRARRGGPYTRATLCPGGSGHNGPPLPGEGLARGLIRWLRMLFDPHYWERFPVAHPRGEDGGDEDPPGETPRR
jgi:hypothetical protein